MAATPLPQPNPRRLLAELRRLDLTEVETMPSEPDQFSEEAEQWTCFYLQTEFRLQIAGGIQQDADGVSRFVFRIPWSESYAERLETLQRMRALIMVLFPEHDASLFRFEPMRWPVGWHPWAPLTNQPEKNP